MSNKILFIEGNKFFIEEDGRIVLPPSKVKCPECDRYGQIDEFSFCPICGMKLESIDK